jgi:hypothetical protein
MKTKKCFQCGEVFTKPQSNSLDYWKRRKFCGRKCAWESQLGVKHTEEHNRKIKESCKGLINAGSFKRVIPIGQKCSLCDKQAVYATPDMLCMSHYIRKWYKYKRPSIGGKKTLYHRIVMEEFIGRKLNQDEVVHHKNGDTMDNRIENLELMQRIDHLKMHGRKRFSK